ncbi:MAG: hypothetical protein WD906_07845 [Anaerolineales bacterium]
MSRGWAVLLYFGGLWAWGNLLSWGRIPFERHDWGEVTGPRLAFLRDAVLNGVWPLHMPGSYALRGITDRFLSVPDTLMSPQALLLGILEPGLFVVANTLLLYTLGFAGLWLFRRWYGLSPFAFGALYFVWALNGHVVDHLMVGHANWAAILLLPWVFLPLLQMAHGRWGWGWTLGLSSALTLVFLQGAFHLYATSLIFVVLLAITQPKLRRAALMSLTFAILMSMVRIAPIALVAGSFDTEFLGGFTTFGQLLASFVDFRLALPDLAYVQGPGARLGWWEVDHYVGVAGVILLTIGVAWLIRAPRETDRWTATFRLPVLGMILLSLSQVFEVINRLGIPILSSQRVATRHFIVPMMLLALLGSIDLSRRLRAPAPRAAIHLAAVGLLAFLANDVWQHANAWRVSRMPVLFQAFDVDLSLAIVANHPDPPYTAALILGLSVSLVSLGFLVGLTLRERFRERRARSKGSGRLGVRST